MKFNANKDLTYRIIIWGSVLLFLGLSIGLFLPIYHEAGLAASLTFSLISGIFAIVILWFWYRTFYIVTNEHLIIHIGPFKRRIELGTIKKIEKTNTQLASAALSKERYYVYYGSTDFTIIAPENMDKFVQVINEQRDEPVKLLK
ncbi:PH domain-containing protein [Paraliobacillus sp. JSM ZJ581]|uniref:PH domain-containing protein n=1 Tax=Paraliobacillus sp. JSM ZJ581 TaxID=3342118 RepID=UPI0035A8A7F5